MGNRKFKMQVCCLIGWVLLYASPLSFARDGSMLRTQGLVNPGGNLKAGYLIINEMRVYIDKTTEVMDHRGKPILITEIKPKNWVYMEVERDPNKRTAKAKKIYLLPHYVDPSKRKNFSFMN